MSASSSAPGAQHQRFAAYLDSLAQAAGHLDRAVPLESYCTGLLLPGERKSVEPMAARLAPDDVQRTHQSLHHFVANAPWSDEALLERVRHLVLPVMKRNGSVVAWIVDDTGFVKSWREGTKQRLRSRFAALRVRIAHRDYWRSEMHREEWLLIEWPRGESEATKYWLSTLPADSKLVDLVKLAKHRWIIERDYEELKQELGLGHYEGRGWRGFHHHGTLCIATYGFLVAERSRFSPSARAGQLDLRTQKFRPISSPVARRIRAERHNPNSIATLRIKLARFLLKQLPCCPFCCVHRL
jgi:SRSO17 transposase